MQIDGKFSSSDSARLIETIPGIEKYWNLSLASEIGDASRFHKEDNIFSYARLAPTIRQLGSRECKGHIGNGYKSLKYMSVERVGLPIINKPDYSIILSYRRIALRSGHK
ncbi:MAG: transposase [Thermoplasmatales archaeon]